MKIVRTMMNVPGVDGAILRALTAYGAATLRSASIEYFPAPVMYNSKKPPMMLRFL